ncbi:MAG: hypothetical protein C0467_19145 [Planctomycetaceae bacterium]|nr:hypothetical protein [Planctomycetaceae bacterium]
MIRGREEERRREGLKQDEGADRQFAVGGQPHGDLGQERRTGRTREVGREQSRPERVQPDRFGAGENQRHRGRKRGPLPAAFVPGVSGLREVCEPRRIPAIPGLDDSGRGTFDSLA